MNCDTPSKIVSIETLIDFPNWIGYLDTFLKSKYTFYKNTPTSVNMKNDEA